LRKDRWSSLPHRIPRPTLHLKTYNVVRCPHCKFVQGVRKQASCKSCGKKLDASKLQVLGCTDKVTELPLIVRRVKESLAKS
jgi:DNA-directed RNA polymerase subunit RPC12/RpoP